MILNLISQYYAWRGYKWPNVWEAMGWANTELGEAYEELLALDGGWVRNNPGDHPTEFDADHFGKELGQCIMMLMVAGHRFGVNPLDILVNDLRSTIDESEPDTGDGGATQEHLPGLDLG